MKDSTLSYYDEYARIYAENTKNVSMKDAYNHFLKNIPMHGNILDFGCGSGRDAKYFHELGYAVDAIDGSEELCKVAREYSGLPVKHMIFRDLSEQNQYDGIWACASILHLPRTELAAVFYKMLRALKKQASYIHRSNTVRRRRREMVVILRILRNKHSRYLWMI